MLRGGLGQGSDATGSHVFYDVILRERFLQEGNIFRKPHIDCKGTLKTTTKTLTYFS